MTSYLPPQFINKYDTGDYIVGGGGVIRVPMTEEEYEVFQDFVEFGGEADLRQLKRMAKEIKRLSLEAYDNESRRMEAEVKLKQEKGRSKKLRAELKEAKAVIADLSSKLDRWAAAIEVAQELDPPEGESSRAARIRARHAGEVFSGMVKE